MKRNGFVFVPREPPKRVILYPVQDSASQQLSNGLYSRAKTDFFIKDHNETISQSNNHVRSSRQQPLSNPLNGTLRSSEKPNHDGTVANLSGHPNTLSAGHKVQNPYYANPFFRPRVITNQQSTTTTNIAILPPSSLASSTATSDVTIQAMAPSSIMAHRGKQPFYPRIQSPLLFANGRPSDSGVTVTASLVHDDNRQWAQPVVQAQTVRPTVNNERTNGPLRASEMNTTTNDVFKQKGSSATHIVISLMDTSRGSNNSGSAPVLNLLTGARAARDDSTITTQMLTGGDQLPSTPPFSMIDISSTANSNNQNWKKALVANFQKNYRNTPSAKLLYTKQSSLPAQTATSSSNNDTSNPEQQKPERTVVSSTTTNERTVQARETSPIRPSVTQRSNENLAAPKQDDSTNNNNDSNNTERSASLQIQKFTYCIPTTTTNKTAKTITPLDATNSNHIPHLSLPIPSALLISKPPTNVEQQQRANITRVMVRRDFVKSIDSKSPIPPTANMRSLMTSQSAKPDGLSTNNVIRVATITEGPNQTYQSQQRQATPLSQKSLLSFTSTNQSIRTDNNQQKSNRGTTNGLNSSPTINTKQPQTGTHNGSLMNNESRRRREENNNESTRTTRRAASASAASDYE